MIRYTLRDPPIRDYEVSDDREAVEAGFTSRPAVIRTMSWQPRDDHSSAPAGWRAYLGIGFVVGFIFGLSVGWVAAGGIA